MGEKIKKIVKVYDNNQPTEEVRVDAQFQKTRIKDLAEIYSDQVSARNRYDKTSSFSTGTYATAEEVRKLLSDGIIDKSLAIEQSRKLYCINPIYASLIDYFSNMFLWRYVVTPHNIEHKKKGTKGNYQEIYNLMLDVVEGLNIEKKAPLILSQLFIEGSVFFITYCDEQSLTIDTICFPSKYAKKIGETQFGTAIIDIDFKYFDSLGLSKEDLTDFLKSFPKEIQDGYRKYSSSPSNNRWQTQDPRFSSCLMLNEKGIPNFIYSMGSIINFEKYNDNELERNENRLKYIVVHKMPLYEDKLIFEVDETKAIHKNLAKIVNTSNKTKLITTYGEVDLLNIEKAESTENDTLEKAFDAIFNNAGINDALFTGESVQALKYSLTKDKSLVWKFVEELMSFYNLVVNNYFDFGAYQADINFLPISQYSYEDDIKSYRENATIGVGKLNYMIASGIRQKNIQDTIKLEDFLGLDQLKPLQTSYTQTNADRVTTTTTEKKEEETTEVTNSDEVKNEKGKD